MCVCVYVFCLSINQSILNCLLSIYPVSPLCTHVYVYVYIYIYLFIYTHIYTHIHTCIQRNTHEIICASKYKCIYMYIYFIIPCEKHVPYTVLISHQPVVKPQFGTSSFFNGAVDFNIYIYIYIYVCVCVCVCVCVKMGSSLLFKHMWLDNKGTFCRIYIYTYLLI